MENPSLTLPHPSDSFRANDWASAILSYLPRVIFHSGHFWLYNPVAPGGGTKWDRKTPKEFRLFLFRLVHNAGSHISGPHMSELVEVLSAFREAPHGITPPFWSPKPRLDYRPDLFIPFRDVLFNPLFDPDDQHDAETYPKTSDYFDPFCLPFSHTPTATCPMWLRFISQLADGRPSFITVLQNFFGYCLIANNSLERILFLQGVSRSGKSTVVEILRDLLGHDNAFAIPLGAIAQPHGSSSLIGRRLITIPEAHTGRHTDTVTATALLKQIVGRDRLYVNIKNKDPFDTVIPAKIVLTSNDIPNFDDTAAGLTSKLIILPFRKSFAANPDINLRYHLSSELPGIANWALIGASRVAAAISNHDLSTLFPPVEGASDIIETISSEGDPIAVWASDRIVPKPLALTNVSSLHSDYSQWALNNAAPEMALTPFGRALSRLSLGSKAKGPGCCAARRGICLRSNVPLPVASTNPPSAPLPKSIRSSSDEDES